MDFNELGASGSSVSSRDEEVETDQVEQETMPKMNREQEEMLCSLMTSLKKDFKMDNFIEPCLKLKEDGNVSTFSVGTTLKLKILEQWPFQKEDIRRPLFQLADSPEVYDKMEEEMMELYSSFQTEPDMDLPNTKKGYHAVMLMDKDRDGDEVVLKRIRFLADPTLVNENGVTNVQTVEVELIDHGFRTSVDSYSSDIFYLDEKFSVLPSRVCPFGMEGMDHYKHRGLFRRLIQPASDEYIFQKEEILTAEIQESGDVVIWSDRFPKEKYPFGMNGFIVELICKSIGLPKLPRSGKSFENCFVAHASATSDGMISVQVDTIITSHLRSVINSVSKEKIEALLRSKAGSLTKTPNVIEKCNLKQVHLAYLSNGEHHRVKIITKDGNAEYSCNGNGTKVRVQLMDSGIEDFVRIQDLVKASDVHPLLSIFPRQFVLAKLCNIEELETAKFLSKYGDGMKYRVHVIKDSQGKNVPEVVLSWEREASSDILCLNEEILKDGCAMAEKNEPVFQYPSLPPTTSLVKRPTAPKLYLGMGQGRRLQVNDKLEVTFLYHPSMIHQFFIMPADREEKLAELNLRFMTRYDKRMRETTLNRVRLTSPPHGEMFILESQTVNRVVRAVLLQARLHVDDVIDSKPEEAENGPNKEKEHLPNDGDVDAKPKPVTIWKMYLMDYGIIEWIRLSEGRITEAEPSDANFPAFGIRAEHVGLKTEKSTQVWWNQVLEAELDTAKVSVQVSALRHGRYGEMAEVEWTESSFLLPKNE